jgi:hypothetical protein
MKKSDRSIITMKITKDTKKFIYDPFVHFVSFMVIQRSPLIDAVAEFYGIGKGNCFIQKGVLKMNHAMSSKMKNRTQML